MTLIDPPPISIRDYRPADFESICAIDRLCFSESIAYTPAEMAFGLAQTGAVAFVAEQGGRIVGFVLASLGRRSLGHIITIDILPEHRSKGLGKRLMQLAEEALIRSGATRIMLEVDVHNDAGLRFYGALGYSEVRLLRNYYSNGSDAHLMEKLFQKPPA